MGQKIKPNAFRLGQALDTTASMLDKRHLEKQVSIGPSVDINGLSQELQVSDKVSYGARLNQSERVKEYMTELVLRMKLVVNKIEVQIANNTGIRVKVQVYYPLNITDVNSYKDYPQLVDGRTRVAKQLESLYKTYVEVELVNRNDVLTGDMLEDTLKRCQRKSKMRETRVSQRGLAGAVMLNSILPGSTILSHLVAMQLEDSRKHSEVINERKNAITEQSRSSTYGLVTYANMSSEKHVGGYRGFRVVIKGTIDGSRRTRKEVITAGVRPLSTISAGVNYAYKQAKTKSGTRGVHVMYCY